jgi:hypothetical protein
MSGDHNMNQTDSAWRKRQIALDKKAENARELGLDYESDKTVMDMAREAGGCLTELPNGDAWVFSGDFELEAFAKLVAAKERELCAKVCEDGINNATDWDSSAWDQACENRAWAIRARGQA